MTVPDLTPEFGGPTGVVLNLASSLRELGHEVVVAGAGNLPEAGVISLPIRRRFHSTPIPKGLGRLRSEIRKHDLVHLHGYRDPLSSSAAFVARRASIPILLEPHGMFRRRLRSLRLKHFFDASIGRSIVAGTGFILATSHLEAQEFVEDGISQDMIRIRPNGLDLTGLLPLPAKDHGRRVLGIPLEAPLISSIGRITAKKGLIDLAGAVSRLPGTWGLIAGPDDGDGTVELLRDAINTQGWSRIKLLVEPVWGQHKADLLGATDVFCLPSATENFGNSVAEAAALGIPVVISERCGVKEWIRDSTAVVPYGDIEALATTLKAKIEDSEAKSRAVENSGHVREELNWTKLSRAQIAIYEELMSRSRGS